MVSAWRLVRWS